MFLKGSKKLKNAKYIKQAIDSYPGGISFSTPNGRPILVNDTMHSLIYRLTGHSMTESNSTWRELENGLVSRDCAMFTVPDFLKEHIDTENSLCFMMNDHSVWTFQRTVLNEENQSTVQITASDTTELYNMTKELYQKNIQLKKMHDRQRTLLNNIVEINVNKELLDAKIYIHDELGQCLLITKKALKENTLSEDKKIITKNWLDALRDLKNVAESPQDKKPSPEAELLDVAKMIGCEIIFSGEEICSKKHMLLIYAAIREALTNAVRHAKANQVIVDIKSDDNFVYVRISNNSDEGPVKVKEGSGLSSLRQRIEQEGAEMTVDCTNSVALNLKIFKEG